jgi:hypothetical protein
MTERLTSLLHEEATALDVPPPPADAIASRGRGLRRRRRATTGLAAVAVAVVVAGSAVGVAGLRDGSPDRATQPATDPASGPAYGVVLANGSRVAVGDGRATVPGTVHDLVFTSEGALVRSNENDGASDGSGPEALTLVRPDGSTVDLGTIAEGVGPATDPDQPLYALAEKDGDGFVAVVRDVRTGDEVGRVPLPDQPPSYWDVPPLALDGDQVYVGYEKTAWAVDWHDGEAEQVPGAQGGIPSISGGRLVTGDRDSISVVDAASGAELMTQPLEGYGYGRLSPDGENLIITIEDDQTFESRATLHSVDGGESLELPAAAGGWGWAWTGQGEAMSAGPGGITVCNVSEGCRELSLPSGFGDDPKPGGQRFES